MSSPININTPPSFDILRPWLDENGIRVHEGLLPVFEDETGWKIVAERDIGIREVLCTVPKDRVLSHRTCSFTSILPLPSNPSSADYTLHLSACLLFEIRLDTASKFWGWLQILPRETIDLPTFWSRDDGDGEGSHNGRSRTEAWRWLRGTEGEKELKRKDQEGLSMSDISSYFNDISSHFPNTPFHPNPPTLADYIYAFSMISTRGYVIDAYHIIALIPFVDLFNHSPSNHTALASDSNVCPTCGSLPSCKHDSSGSDRLSNFSSAYIERVQEEGGGTVDMRVERAVKSGEEVFSCYEQDVSDGKLLVEWGFCLGGKDGQGVIATWTAREVLDESIGQGYMALIHQSEILERLSEREGAESWVYPSTGPGDFGMKGDGRISSCLFIVLCLHSLESFPETIEELEEGCLGVLDDKIESRESSAVVRFAENVRAIVQARLEGMYGSGRGIEELKEEPVIHPSGQLSKQLALAERRGLERVLSRWA